MTKTIKNTFRFLGTMVISTGTKGIIKSPMVGMYEPEIPKELSQKFFSEIIHKTPYNSPIND